ncbi:MAG: ASKHA domain-containing protein, partial [Desulfobacterales bacterium]
MPAVVEASEPSNVRRWVQTVTLAPPTLKDNTADADRLAAALKGRIGVSRLKIGLPLLRTLPDRLRRWHYRARCLLFQDGPLGQLVALTAPDDAAPLTGLAVDLGTTRVVLRLVDLESGRTLGESAFDNPQIAVGPDILVRIQHAESDSGCDALQRLIVDGLNAQIDDLSRSCGLSAEDVYLAAVAGNTAMTHLFMGLPARWIIREPYTPAVNRPGVLSAAALGLRVNPAGRVLVFPNIGSYFGGDLIAGILFAGLHRREATAILVDVGTNAEVVVGSRHWLMGCAGAAGPALEGGVSAIGMMAGPGVIDRVRIDPASGAFEVHTIGDLAPRGICGSGVIDLAAQLFLAGMIDIRGKLRAEVCGDRWRELDGLAHLVVV